MPDSRYRITERIAAGGMAEVFKGVAESLQGFKKSVAIKRILPALTKNKKFVSMFLDEARLSLHLQHANIVQVFDIGHADDDVLHRHGVRRRRRPQGDDRVAPPQRQAAAPSAQTHLHHDGGLQGAGLRARARPTPRPASRSASSTATSRRRTSCLARTAR